MLRIIAGKYGGRQLKQPDLDITRPTTDRIREAIFSSIQFEIEGSIVLDLFSGSGAFSFESVSRGAMKAISVENNLKASRIIEENKKALDVSNIDVYNTDSNNFLKSKAGTKFNLIFMDPPYEQKELYNETLENISHLDLLANSGYIILETNSPESIVLPTGLMIQREKKYGKITVMFISKI